MSSDIPFNPKLTPSISAISEQKKFLNFQNVLDISRKSSSSPLVVQFCKNVLKICLKDKTESHELLRMIGPFGCRTTVVKLMVWAGGPRSDGVKGQKIFTKDLLRGTLFFARL